MNDDFFFSAPQLKRGPLGLSPSMVQHFGPSPSDLAFLASTGTLPWDRVWVQGGAITNRRTPDPGVYEVSQLTLGTVAPLWISADSADIDDAGVFNEVFFIAVGPDQHIGEADYEKRWRPLRAELAHSPPDLAISQFQSPPRRYQLVTAKVAVGPDDVLVDSGLLVTNATGARLLFYCDDQVPLDMFITTDTHAIHAYLANAAALQTVGG